MNGLRKLRRLLPTGRAAQWMEIGLGIGLIVLAMLWQAGALSGHKIEPGAAAPAATPAGVKSIPVQAVPQPVIYRAVGTVHSRTQIDLSPRIVARILEIPVRSGDRVAKGALLARLDDAELAAGARQAAERSRQAQAALDLATTELERARKLLASGTVTQQAFDQSDSLFRQARAAAQAAEDARHQAEAVLGYATLTSPLDGVVSERLADPGDLASPGNICLRLFDPTRLMLEVPVREGLVSRIRLGEQVPFQVDALRTNLFGEVREVVPAVDPGSRTFLVKLCISHAPPQLVPGMFGVLSLAIGTRPALLVPEQKVSRIGQLEYVRAVLAGQARTILVRTTPAEAPGMREVVSGLEPGMTLADE